MNGEKITEERVDLSYDERMDHLVSNLKNAASQSRRKRRKELMISLVIAALLGIAIYYGARQATSGGEMMHFLNNIM